MLPWAPMTNLQLMSIQRACSMSQVSPGYDGDTEASHFSYLSATWANRFSQVSPLLYEFNMLRTFSHSHTAWWKFMGLVSGECDFAVRCSFKHRAIQFKILVLNPVEKKPPVTLYRTTLRVAIPYPASAQLSAKIFSDVQAKQVNCWCHAHNWA